MKIWAKTEEFSEGKYLVVRRDGTIPKWPHFVLGGDDPNAPAALRAYASEAESNLLDPEYIDSVRELADDWSNRDHSTADPDAPPHRKDNPAIIRLMRGEGDLTQYSTPVDASPPDPETIGREWAGRQTPPRRLYGTVNFWWLKVDSPESLHVLPEPLASMLYESFPTESAAYAALGEALVTLRELVK